MNISDTECSDYHFLCNIYSLDTISEKVRFVCLYNDNIKKVPPVFSHHVRHSFIPAHRKKKKLERQIATEVHPRHESEWTQ